MNFVTLILRNLRWKIFSVSSLDLKQIILVGQQIMMTAVTTNKNLFFSNTTEAFDSTFLTPQTIISIQQSTAQNLQFTPPTS